MGNIRIKVCGITRLQDALLAERMGADALGFIFVDPSPRYIPPAEARAIISHLRPFTVSVGVIVDASQRDAAAVIETTGVNVVQLHGGESPDLCRGLHGQTGVRIVKALPATPDVGQVIKDYEEWVDGFLIDTSSGRRFFGGTGKIFDWDLLNQLETSRPVIVAGGLNAGNIQCCLRKAPGIYGVDVNSGVEVSPGVKSPEKLRKFIEEVRHYEHRDAHQR